MEFHGEVLASHHNHKFGFFLIYFLRITKMYECTNIILFRHQSNKFKRFLCCTFKGLQSIFHKRIFYRPFSELKM